jgi:GT2 family glycosyltransferase
MSPFAPLALFCFNRPRHLKRVLDALMLNDEFRKTRVYAFCDGPRSETDIEDVGKVRRLLHARRKDLDIHIVERDENFGLRRSILEGVTGVVQEWGRVIVLEDDIVVSPFFLGYMNLALERYMHEDRVMHISGYFLPVDPDGLPETFFYRPTSCWGWATWANRWQHLDLNGPKLMERLQGDAGYRFDLDGAYAFKEHLRLNIIGQISTWAIFWYASVFLKGGLSLHPACSLTANIGHDGSGVNCKGTDAFKIRIAEAAVRHLPNTLEEYPLALARARDFFLNHTGI